VRNLVVLDETVQAYLRRSAGKILALAYRLLTH